MGEIIPHFLVYQALFFPPKHLQNKSDLSCTWEMKVKMELSYLQGP
jgi:hypothetical protein